MTCAISWGRCSLIGFLVVMSVVVVLVLLLLVFWRLGRGCACPLVLCSLLLLSILDRLRLVYLVFFVRRLPTSSRSKGRVSVPV